MKVYANSSANEIVKATTPSTREWINFVCSWGQRRSTPTLGASLNRRRSLSLLVIAEDIVSCFVWKGRSCPVERDRDSILWLFTRRGLRAAKPFSFLLWVCWAASTGAVGANVVPELSCPEWALQTATRVSSAETSPCRQRTATRCACYAETSRGPIVIGSQLASECLWNAGHWRKDDGSERVAKALAQFSTIASEWGAARASPPARPRHLANRSIRHGYLLPLQTLSCLLSIRRKRNPLLHQFLLPRPSPVRASCTWRCTTTSLAWRKISASRRTSTWKLSTTPTKTGGLLGMRSRIRKDLFPVTSWR